MEAQARGHRVDHAVIELQLELGLLLGVEYAVQLGLQPGIRGETRPAWRVAKTARDSTALEGVDIINSAKWQGTTIRAGGW